MWFVMTSLAAPQVVVNDDHSVTGTVELKTTPDTLKSKLADPVWLAGVDGNGTQVTVLERVGDCVVTKNVSPSAIKTVTYSVKQCPTATGFVATLVESNTFNDYRMEWTFTPSDTGTKAVYELSTDTSMMVPQFIIDRSTKKGVLHMLEKLQGHFAG